MAFLAFLAFPSTASRNLNIFLQRAYKSCLQDVKKISDKKKNLTADKKGRTLPYRNNLIKALFKVSKC